VTTPERHRKDTLQVTANPVFLYRMLTLAEGWSFVLLLVFGSVLSRISDIDLVMPLGMLHGVLFVMLVLATFFIRRRLSWGFGTTLVALVCSVIPLAPFFFHRAKKQEFLAAERAAQPA
jgi:integral membrane protein